MLMFTRSLFILSFVFLVFLECHQKSFDHVPLETITPNISHLVAINDSCNESKENLDNICLLLQDGNNDDSCKNADKFPKVVGELFKAYEGRKCDNLDFFINSLKECCFEQASNEKSCIGNVIHQQIQLTNDSQ